MDVNKHAFWWLNSGGDTTFNNLVTYISLNDEYGWDTAGGENHVSRTVSTGSTLATVTTGKLGNGYDFNGSSDYVIIYDKANLSFTSGGGTDLPFTFNFWIRLDSIAANQWIFSKRDASTNEEYAAWIDTSGRITFNCFSNGGASAYIGQRTNSGLSISTWYNISIEYDATKANGGIRIYINDSLQAMTAVSAGTYLGMAAGTNNLILGAQSWGSFGGKMNGILDSISIFSNVLSDDQRTAIYNSGDGLAYTQDNAKVSVDSSIIVFASNGSYLLAHNKSTTLKFSTNGGSSWTDYEFGANTPNIDGGGIFDTGEFFFSVRSTMYASTDGNITVSPITAYLEDGTTPYPIHTPANASLPGNYYQMLSHDKKQYVSGEHVFLFINYCNVANGAAPVTVWRARVIAGNVSVKALYRFGQNPNYRDNGTAGGGATGTLLGDSGNAIITRHGHFLAQHGTSSDFYCVTGDGTSEVHWFKFVYDINNDEFSSVDHIIDSAASNTRWKVTAIQFNGSNVVWCADATGAVAATERGIFSAAIADVVSSGVSASSSRLFDVGDTTMSSISINQDTGELIGIFDSTQRLRQMLVLDSFGASNPRFITIYTAATDLAGVLQQPDANGYWRFVVGWLHDGPPIQTIKYRSSS